MLTVPTLGATRPAPFALPAGGVQPVARAALLHTLSGLTQNCSQTLQTAGTSYLEKISGLTGVAGPAVTGLAGVGAADAGVSLARYEGA